MRIHFEWETRRHPVIGARSFCAGAELCRERCQQAFDQHRCDRLYEGIEAAVNPLERAQRKNAFYLVFRSPAVSCCCSSDFCQLELGLYSFMALARTSVFLPRSFS